MAALIYLSVAVFLLGMGWRVFTWLRAPVPLKIPLTPGPTTAAGVVGRMAGEVFLFRSLFDADRTLWVAAWIFHVSLVLLAVGHVAGLVVPDFAASTLDLTPAQFSHLAYVTGGVFGILAVVPLIYLFIRRFTMERVRHVSTLSDYLALALLFFAIQTGNHMRFMGDLDIVQAREFVAGLLTFRPVPPPHSGPFVAHMLLVCVLVAYIPFSKLMHLGGIFFSPTLNQPNDSRQQRHVNPWDHEASKA
ncbi:MAG: respiratory nitrate reductase subunit gamma [Verrucomicrobia bacterium]|nr:respiratory nitrate reductase subunit gamma [Verrucomicrobiota bacterium]